MSISKHKEWILETIDQLRQRKARPDLDRIAHMVERKYGLNHSSTQSILDKLVESRSVIKVDYKGNTSYRNAAKWKKSLVSASATNSGIRIANALLSLRKEAVKSGSEVKGATALEIEKWLVAKNPETRLVKNRLQAALQREINANNIEQLPNGAYILCNDEESETSSEERETNTSEKSAGETPPLRSPGKRLGRPPSKRKKIKKTHGPDFETPGSKRARSLSQLEDGAKCDYCLLTAECNSKGKPEGLLTCTDCNAKAHPSCMDYTEELAQRALNSPWQCIDCKTCYICADSEDPDCMLFCDSCDKGYHMNCHDPPVSEKPTGKWVCGKCQQEDVAWQFEARSKTEMGPQESQNADTTGASCLPTPSASPVPFETEEKENKVKANLPQSLARLKILQKGYPDASEWTVADVANFFKELGFEEQAQAFKDQEIDGKSLLLMKRLDVLTGLSIRLGPALKIYQHVMKLQTAFQDNS
ncbi:hypothetical protein CHS0354_042131 [Potamilus streckersoni]|uniref:Histone acetyltransferase n=1 Tax=Potamilus streckersoni TaxID=2493646 RepID=A0AAE0TLI1_9BIVA|nr:hypothetical protein CHS0354_042131 [Potamilus streckersoni]